MFIENREDINGILQISFKNERDLKRAQELIRKNTNYRVYLN